MDKGIYYTPPSDASFEDMKERAIGLWSTYDDTYGYASEKIERIRGIPNVQDNFMYIFVMFDMDNQRKIVAAVQPTTRDDIRERMIDGGNSEGIIRMIGL